MRQKQVSNRCCYICLIAKSDLAGLKAEEGKIDIQKLKTVTNDLSKFCNVLDNYC